MKILFISDNFTPETNAPATRTYEHCKEWVKTGANVTVITCAPNFPTGKIFKGYKNKIFQKEIIDGIKVIRVWSYISANEGFLKRTVDYLSFSITSLIMGIFIKTEIIIATSPQFFTTISAFFLSKIKRKPWVFELRDLWPESIEAVGIIKNKKIIFFLEKIELFLYKNCSLIIALTEAFKNNLISRGIKSQKIKVISNGANFDLFYKREKNRALLKELGLERKFIISYIGTHGMAHALDFIVNSIVDIKDKNIQFLFIGEGAEKKKIVNLAKKIRLNNATFLDSMPKENIPDYLSITDVVLVNLKKSDTFKTVLPSKIFEAAAMEKPILLGVDGQARGLIEKYEAGIFFEPEDKNDFLKKTEKIYKDKDFYLKMQKGCEKLARDFDRKSLAKEMLNNLKKVIK